jgi:hypothetical protein
LLIDVGKSFKNKQISSEQALGILQVKQQTHLKVK